MRDKKMWGLVVLCVAASISLTGCGTIKGIGSDIGLVAEILKSV